MKFGTQQHISNSMTAGWMTKCEHFKNRFRHNSVFGHNLAAECPISVTFCVGKQTAFHRISEMCLCRLRKLYLYGVVSVKSTDDVTRLNPRLRVEK